VTTIKIKILAELDEVRECFAYDWQIRDCVETALQVAGMDTVITKISCAGVAEEEGDLECL